jgi:hypothetical protein
MIRGALAMMEMKMAKEERMSPLFEGHKLVREHSLIKLDVNFSVLAIIDLIKKEMKKKV